MGSAYLSFWMKPLKSSLFSNALYIFLKSCCREGNQMVFFNPAKLPDMTEKSNYYNTNSRNHWFKKPENTSAEVRIKSSTVWIAFKLVKKKRLSKVGQDIRRQLMLITPGNERVMRLILTYLVYFFRLAKKENCPALESIHLTIHKTKQKADRLITHTTWN